MSKNFAETVSASLKALVPYNAGRTPAQIRHEHGVADALKMSSNENPLGPSPAAMRALSDPRNLDIHCYPDAAAADLRTALAAMLGISADAIVCGNGSNDIIELCATLALAPGRKAVYSEHSFICYRLVTAARGATATEVPAKKFGHDLDGMAAACADPQASVVFAANPNNPTGSWHEPQQLLAFLRKVPSRVLAVLDEAYLEYAEHGRGESIGWIGEFPNLVICRTFSKIHGLAGLRIGYAIAGEQMASLLNRVRQPFNANTVAQCAALAALGDRQFVELSRQTNDEGMLQLQEGFANMGVVSMPSQGNFIPFRPGTQKAEFEELVKLGVIVRNLHEYGLDGWLRSTVGTAKQNEKILAAVARLRQ